MDLLFGVMRKMLPIHRQRPPQEVRKQSTMGKTCSRKGTGRANHW